MTLPWGKQRAAGRSADDGALAGTATEVAPELERRRELAEEYRADELQRQRADARHDRDVADVATEVRLANLERAEREEQALADAELARMYRHARASGERTRIGAHIARSGEARALRLERLRVLNLKVLVPVLLGFAAWSTTGVHHGAARPLDIGEHAFGDPMWWALWLLEPALIGAVVWIIIVRARLAACGGQLDPRAGALAIGCLGTSVILNFAAAVPHHAPAGLSGVFSMLSGMLGHGIAPLAAAGTAHLIGIVDDSIAAADPWHENGQPVPLLADMDLRLGNALDNARPVVTSTSETRALPPAPTRWPLPVGDRELLPITVSEPPAATVRRTSGHQDKQQPSKAARRPRPNKGEPIPPAARKPTTTPSVRALPDVELRQRLDALIEAGELPASAPVRQVQAALGIGFNRAKRVLAIPTPDRPSTPDQTAA